MAPLKRLCDLNTRVLREDTDPHFDFLYADLAAVNLETRKVTPRVETFSEAPSRARRLVFIGDSLIPSLTGSTNWVQTRPLFIKGVELASIVFSTGFFTVTPRPSLDSRFLNYTLASLPILQQLEAQSSGVTMKGFSAEALGNQKIPVPDIKTQCAIADYLDTETARIDALIEKKQRMIELLDQLPWSQFVQALSNLKVSEVSLRRVVSRITDGPFGSSLTSAHYVSSGARVVRLGNIRTGWFDQSDNSYIEPDHFKTLLRHRVRPGDLLIAGLGDSNNHVGRACIAPDLGPAIVKADCYCAKVDEHLALPEFVAIYLSSTLGRDRVEIAARGTTRSRINIEIAKEIMLSLPSLANQAIVVSTFQEVKARSSATSTKIRGQLTLLYERRRALITAAVTGELEVPGVTA